MSDWDFNRTVRGLYRAAAGDVPWQQVLDDWRQGLGARALSVQWLDAGDGRLIEHHEAGDELHGSTLDYLRRWHQVDPLASKHPEGSWSFNDHWYAAPAVETHPFARHYLPARASGHSAQFRVPAHEGQGGRFLIEWGRGRGAPEQTLQAALDRLGLHLREALDTRRRLRRLWPLAPVGQLLLERQAHPCWLLRGGGGILHANSAAGAISEGPASVGVLEGNLYLRHAPDQAALRAGLVQVQRLARGDQVTVRLRGAANGTLAASPVFVLQRLDGVGMCGAFAAPGEDVVVLARLFDPHQHHPLDEQALAAVLDLTPAQARVAVQVAQGLTAGEIATALAVRESTVRSHLRVLLTKLGAARKGEAARMLAQGAWLLRRCGSGGGRDA
jgi:DNA-binding CsgD family transcriptional regulator/PAS domain-containing protein